MELQNLSIEGLKALIYDQLALREQCTVNINIIQQEIQKRDKPEVKEE